MKNLDFKAIGLKIKERRLSLGLTQDDISNYLDVNPSHISNIECGRANPSLTVLVNIANLLKCSIDYFLVGEYTYNIDNEKFETIDNRILDKLKYCELEKKERLLKIIDLI